MSEFDSPFHAPETIFRAPESVLPPLKEKPAGQGDDTMLEPFPGRGNNFAIFFSILAAAFPVLVKILVLGTSPQPPSQQNSPPRPQPAPAPQTTPLFSAAPSPNGPTYKPNTKIINTGDEMLEELIQTIGKKNSQQQPTR